MKNDEIPDPVKCEDNVPQVIVPVKRLRPKPKKAPEFTEENKSEQVVNAFDFIKNISGKAKTKDTTHLDSSAKLYMISELERTKEIGKIANKFNVEEQVLKNWTKRYYETGNLRTSVLKTAAPSEALQRAFEELETEENS